MRFDLSLFKSAVLYFVLVFAVGFILGTFRVLVLLPAIGERYAELLELPIMLAVTICVARWIVSRMSPPVTVRRGLAIGLAGFAILLFAELAVLVFIRQQTLQEYLAGRDAVAGIAYLGCIIIFALMPAIVICGMKRKDNNERAKPLN